MMYLIYLTDRWGVDTYNILVCNTEEQAESLVERYDKLKKRFNNLNEEDIQHRENEIPILARDLQITPKVLSVFLDGEYEGYSEKVNFIKMGEDE